MTVTHFHLTGQDRIGYTDQEPVEMYRGTNRQTTETRMLAEAGFMAQQGWRVTRPTTLDMDSDLQVITLVLPDSNPAETKSITFRMFDCTAKHEED